MSDMEEQVNALHKALLKASVCTNIKSSERLKVGSERFAIVKVNYTEIDCIVTDIFNEKTKMHVALDTFYSHSLFGEKRTRFINEGETIIIADNGTQFNISRWRDDEWDSFLGYGLLSDQYYHWQKFVTDCCHYDAVDDFMWGLGKYKDSHKSHADSVLQVKKILEKKFGKK